MEINKNFKSFEEFCNFLTNEGEKNGIYIDEYTQIYDALETCMAHSEAIEYGHGELTNIAFSDGLDGWSFTITYTYPDGKTFTIERAQED